MPESQNQDADNQLICQENQSPQRKGLNLSEPFIMEQARKADRLCVLFIIVLVAATSFTFCYTRSPLSFSFLPLLPLPLAIRRRKDEAIFPIRTEDFQLQLRALDIEMEKIRKQNPSVILTFLNWLKRLFKR